MAIAFRIHEYRKRNVGEHHTVNPHLKHHHQHEIENPNMKDQGNECISDRDIHMIDALQNGIGHCRHGQEYHCRGTGNQHPDSLCVVAALEKQIINRTERTVSPTADGMAISMAKRMARLCLGDNRPLPFWQPPRKVTG